MTVEQDVCKIIEKHFPDECEFAGSANTTDIVRFVMSGTPPTEIAKNVAGGNDLNLIEAINILVAASVIAKNAIDVFKAMQKSGDADAATKEKKEEAAVKLKQVVDATRDVAVN